MNSRAVQAGTCYLICFDQPYRHARHYLGWAANLDARLAAHRAGNGARLVSVITAAGIGWTLARTWEGATEQDEKALKELRNGPGLCPRCTPGTTRGTVITPRTARRPKPAQITVMYTVTDRTGAI